MLNKCNTFIFLSFFSIMLNRCYANEATLVLQNGLDGYDGCEDTYIHITGLEPNCIFDNENYSNETKLKTSN